MIYWFNKSKPVLPVLIILIAYLFGNQLSVLLAKVIWNLSTPLMRIV